MATTEFDYLIIGQGLAGSILAHQLITHGQRVMVIDNDHSGSSSKVAAGIINPITGPRLSHAEHFASLFEEAKTYYAKLEYHIKKSVFSEIKQQDYPLIDITGTAIVDTKALLEASKVWLSSLHCYRKLAVDYGLFSFNENSVHYQDLKATNVIFCEGYQAINNPWLNHLPFKLAKGEILTLSNPTQLQTMLSWEKWLVPHQSILKLGSNFDWDNLELTASEMVKQSLTESVKKYTHLECDVIKHEVGIRPSTRQREPFIGALPALNNAYCFNGFGSKGCLFIPHYASLLSKHLLQQTPLPTKVTKWL